MFTSCRKCAFITDCWVHWRRCSLDEVQQVAAELRQNGGSMVCNKPSITSTTCVSHVDRRCSHHPAVYVRDLEIYLDRDYGNSVLVSIPFYLMRRRQSVLNAAARLIFHLRPHQ